MMNERNELIRELAKKSGLWFVTPREDLIDDFAELIVRECVDIADKETMDDTVGYTMLEHFRINQ